jgi:tRNA U34 2-thiouridine synthase MnmA/TrmU
VQVLGVFMRNWDEAEERGNENCSVERDRQVSPSSCTQKVKGGVEEHSCHTGVD